MSPPEAPRLEVTPVGRVSVASTLWRASGRLSVTVIAKASFAFAHGAPMTPIDPEPVTAGDEFGTGKAARTLVRTTDLVPYLARADVFMTGHARSPEPAASLAVRLAVFREDKGLLDKTVHVAGKEGAPFEPVPLIWDRALGGPGTANPLGVAKPSLTDPKRPDQPVAFAPVPRAFPARSKLVPRPQQKALDAPLVEIPEGFDWAFFQAAPVDQWVDYLEGDEWILLEGVSQTAARVQSRLPFVNAVARVAQEGGAMRLVTLTADTLRIDADAMTCSVTWRSSFPVSDESVLARLRVACGLEVAGQAIAWPALAPPKRSLAPPPSEPLEDLTDVVESGEITQVTQVTPPGVTSPPRPGAPRPSKGRASMPPPPPPRPAQASRPDFSATLALPDDGVPDAGAKPAWVPVVDKSTGRQPPPRPAAGAPPRRMEAPAVSVAAPTTEPIPDLAGPPPTQAFPETFPGAPPARPARSVSPLPFKRVQPPPPPPTSVYAAPARQSTMAVAPDLVPEAPPLVARPARPAPPRLPPEIAARAPAVPAGQSISAQGIRIHNMTALGLATAPQGLSPARGVLAVIAKATCDLVPGGPAEVRDDPEPFVDAEADDGYPSDLVPFKVRADVVALGYAFPPGGPAASMEARFAFGGETGFDRRIAVFGDRVWVKAPSGLKASAPAVFAHVPLSWARAFGGPGFDANPAGLGHPGKHRRGAPGLPLPNLEDPERPLRSPHQAPEPVGFGPRPRSWRDRALERTGRPEPWTTFPEELDWTQHQSAPRAQQLAFLRGNEPFTLVGMHQAHATFEGQLPGLEPRCYATRVGQGGPRVEVVSLELDTVIFEPQKMTVTLLYRGALPVLDEAAPAAEIPALLLSVQGAGSRALTLAEARGRLLGV